MPQPGSECFLAELEEKPRDYTGTKQNAPYLIKGTSFLGGIEANCWQRTPATAAPSPRLAASAGSQLLSTSRCSLNPPLATLEVLR